MRTSILLTAALLVAACSSSPEGAVDFDATLSGNPGYESIRGSATAVAGLGNTVITIDVEGAEPGARHPWHVHRGTCGSGGGIVGNAAAYPLLEIESDGGDRESARIDVQLDDDEDYYVNVHLSPQNPGVIVACGELVD